MMRDEPKLKACKKCLQMANHDKDGCLKCRKPRGYCGVDMCGDG